MENYVGNGGQGANFCVVIGCCLKIRRLLLLFLINMCEILDVDTIFVSCGLLLVWKHRRPPNTKWIHI